MGKKYFTLGFDGNPKIDRRLMRLMNDYGMKGTFYLNPQQLHRRDIIKVYQEAEIAPCASISEQYGSLPQEQIQRMMDKDIEKLWKLSGKPVLGYAYATGHPSGQTQAYLQEKGILYARGILSGRSFTFPQNPMCLQPTCSHMDKLISIERKLQTFLEAEAEEDLLFLLWGRTHELDYGLREASWEKLERIFQLVAERKNIVYCTNAEAIQAHTALSIRG